MCLNMCVCVYVPLPDFILEYIERINLLAFIALTERRLPSAKRSLQLLSHGQTVSISITSGHDLNAQRSAVGR